MSGWAVSDLRAWRRLRGARPARAQGARKRPVVWLVATAVEALAPLHVLIEALAEHRLAPECRVVMAFTARADATLLQEIAPGAPDLMVLAGPRLPVPLLAGARGAGVGLFWVDVAGPPVIGSLRLVPGYTRGLLEALDEIHLRDSIAQRGLRRILGNSARVHLTGPLAQYGSAPGCNASELSQLQDAMAQRPVWLGYDLPAAEEDAVLLAHAQALRRAHRLLLIAIPRDPARAAAMAERARDIGFDCARRSQEDEITETTQVYIADAEDAPGLFLRLASVGYLGGSLTKEAGSPSVVLAASLGTAMVFGRQALTGPEGGFANQLRAAGAGRLIMTAPELGEAISTLLAPDTGALAALAAWELATMGGENTADLARAICDWLQLNLPGQGA